MYDLFFRDRSTLLSLINELSGAKDNTLDDIDDSNSIGTNSDAEIELSPGLDQEKHSPSSPNAALLIESNKSEHNELNTESEKNKLDSNEDSHEMSINLKRKLIKDSDEDNLHNKLSTPIVGEAIEESVMFVKGEGSGKECDTGNPDETNTQNDTTKIEDTKKPKLWSIETICSSSKEVQEEIISVPKTGFFFGDDSVPCFNNVSNGENSHPDETKSKLDLSKQKDEVDATSTIHHVETSSKESSTKNQEEFTTKNSTQSVFNIKVHEEEVQITERNANEVFIKSESSVKNDAHKISNVNSSTPVETLVKTQEPKLNNLTQVIDKNKESQLHSSNESNKYDTKPNVGQMETITPKVSNVNEKQPTDPLMYDAPVDKQIREQEKLNMKIKENEIKKLKIDQKLITEVDDQILKVDDSIQISKQSTSEVNLNNEVGIVESEKVKVNEFPANTKVQCGDIIEESSVDVVKQKSSAIDETKLSNLVDSTINADNQILTNDNCNIVCDKETIVNSIVENNEKDKQVPEDLCKHIPTTDDLETNATCSKDSKQQTEVSNVHVKNNFDQCLKTSKQIDDTSNNKKLKKMSHNISNIIRTDMVVDNDSTKEQAVYTVIDEIKQPDKCQIKNANDTVDNIFHEDKKSDLNVNYQKVSNIDIHPDEVSPKSDLNKEIPENLIFKKKLTEKFEVKDKPESSNLEIEINRTNTDNSEVKIKELSLKSIDILNDSTKLKIDSEITEDKTSIAQKIPFVHENQKEILDKIDLVPIIKEDKGSVRQFNKKIKLNKSKKENHKLMSTEDKTDCSYEETSKLEELKNVSSYKENETSSTMEPQIVIDEKIVAGISQDGKNIKFIYLI